jgi:asparagine synthase (glutamine-hydrolysing)
VDPLSGNQPLYSHDRNLVCTVNGEIYNHEVLRDELQDTRAFRTRSDCEVIVHLFNEVGTEVAAKLDGDFAFVIVNEVTGSVYAARDRIGVNSMYVGRGSDGSVWFSSELKPLVVGDCVSIEQFPPGHYYCREARKDPGSFTRYDAPPWTDPAQANRRLNRTAVRRTLTSAVTKRLMADVPYGVFLSGGLDSSLVASIIARERRERFLARGDPDDLKPLKSFSIGLHDSPDLAAARDVAAFIGTEHYAFEFTVQEGIDAISDVIYHLETYDITTIRAGTPMFLLARKVKAMGIKMVFSGEGADEIFAGYLYFHKAPSGEALHEECVRKVHDLHRFDCLRANKATMAHGLEVRVPFLDKDMVDEGMMLSGDVKLRRANASTQFIEKWALREAFNTPDNPYLPDDVLWRQKEQFSDGVGYNWIDGLKAHADRAIGDAEMANAALRFPHNTPTTKEGLYIRQIFHHHFPNNQYGNGVEYTVPGGASVACSTATAIEWDAAWGEPGRQDQSGRFVESHLHSNDVAAPPRLRD